MTEGGAPAWPGADEWPDCPELAATAQHLDMLHRKIEVLRAAQQEAWEQQLVVARRLYDADRLTPEDLMLVREKLARRGPGWMKDWDTAMPIPGQKLRHLVERRRREGVGRRVWSGGFPLEGLTPLAGTPVVYVLYAATNEPVYVGSTGDFRARMKGHHILDRCEITHWVAYRCTDREHAYQEEERLLATHKPRLNVRSTR